MKLREATYLSIIFYVVISLVFLFFLNNVLNVDSGLAISINSIYNPSLDSIFLAITIFGSTIFWAIMIILMLLVGDRKMAIYLFFALLIDSFLTLALKSIFLRPRPFEALPVELRTVETNLGSSFPSGHAERVFSGAVILGYKYKKLRIALFILAILVSFSRVYLGVHYPIDVFFGAMNGIVMGLAVLNIPTKRIEKALKKIFD